MEPTTPSALSRGSDDFFAYQFTDIVQNDRRRDQIRDPCNLLHVPLLFVRDHSGVNVTSFEHSPYYFMFATLTTEDGSKEIHILPDYQTHIIRGSVVSSIYFARDTDDVEGAFFLFPDISVRVEGTYRLKFSLFEIVGNVVYFCKSCISSPFTIYSAKKFPGMDPSTALSQAFAKQGLKVRMRSENRRKKSHPSVDDDDGGASDAGPSAGAVMSYYPPEDGETTHYAKPGASSIDASPNFPLPDSGTSYRPGLAAFTRHDHRYVREPPPGPPAHGGAQYANYSPRYERGPAPPTIQLDGQVTKRIRSEGKPRPLGDPWRPAGPTHSLSNPISPRPLSPTISQTGEAPPPLGRLRSINHLLRDGVRDAGVTLPPLRHPPSPAGASTTFRPPLPPPSRRWESPALGPQLPDPDPPAHPGPHRLGSEAGTDRYAPYSVRRPEMSTASSPNGPVLPHSPHLPVSTYPPTRSRLSPHAPEVPPRYGHSYSEENLAVYRREGAYHRPAEPTSGGWPRPPYYPASGPVSPAPWSGRHFPPPPAATVGPPSAGHLASEVDAMGLHTPEYRPRHADPAVGREYYVPSVPVSAHHYPPTSQQHPHIPVTSPQSTGNTVPATEAGQPHGRYPHYRP
ncbi:hypothetical protein IWQ60_000263 [Tieghemiomyces parasiticus]|uniref:Velvet domain-containing protein n=1 Tax=Tieghemiomyces parasiticus TaxID=78921 RepID=A0A9W8AJ75_9FUNG|nr:hypothetical protein IWQ60_000263 [Tieghemiomyces parasiticus]